MEVYEAGPTGELIYTSVVINLLRILKSPEAEFLVILCTCI
jgi:hypothetical protein